MPERSIFRESAIKKYRQRQEQGIVLHAASPPVWVFLWVVLLLLFGAGGFAWSVEVPISVQGQGVVVEQETPGQVGSEVVAVLFFSPDQTLNLHEGQPATVSIGANVLTVVGSIGRVDTALISPNEARSRYNLQGGLAQIVSGPSITVSILLGTAASDQIYAGSLCGAQIRVGSRRVLSFLPGFKQIFGK